MKGFISCVLVCAAFVVGARAQSDTAFTYQGELTENGAAAHGLYDMDFLLWDAAAGGAQVGSTIALPDVDVSDGRFTVELDFGAAAFDNSARWLEITVDGSVLNPRQQIARSPYALQARGIFVDESENVGIGTTAPDRKLHVMGPIYSEGSAADIGVANPNNPTAAFGFNWDNDLPRIRIGGEGPGTSSGFDIQTVANRSLLRILNNGNVGIGATDPQAPLHVRGTIWSDGPTAGLSVRNPNNDAASIGMGWDNDVARLRVGGDGVGAGNGLDIQTIANRSLLRILYSGNVGIGTTSPLERLHVVSEDTAILGDGATGVYGISQTNDGVGVLGFSFTDNGVTYGVEGLNTSPLGRGVFGHATAATGNNTGVWGQTEANSGRGVYGYARKTTGLNYGVFGQSDSTNGRGVYGYATATTGVNYGVYGETASVDGFGVVARNTGSSGSEVSYALFAEATGTRGIGVFGNAASSAGVNYGVVGRSDSGDGFDFYAAGAGTNYGSSSSRRWKSNIEPIANPLGKLARLRGVSFDWDAEHGGHHDIGMIAEEVGDVLPEIVQYEDNGVDAIGMDYSKLSPLLVEAVNALRADKDAEIAQLRADNASLRDRLAAVERAVAVLAVARNKETTE